MKIIRKKLIFCPDGSLPWAKTHAMNPTIDVLNDEVIRVYFASLDENKKGRIGYADVSADDPSIVLNFSKNPVLDLGEKGNFDDNGVIPSCIMNRNGKKYLYYFGFQLAQLVRFLMFTGVAISEDGGNTFERYAHNPVLAKNDTDLYVRSLPHVLEENGVYKVWYSAVREWTTVLGKELPVGNIRYTESQDGLNFDMNPPITCLQTRAEEFSLSRPFVFYRDNKYHMFFSSRLRSTDRYQLGYAESPDGKTWNRDDAQLTVGPPSGDWDSEMICYTSLVTVKNKSFLFYNGNGIGASGFGYAEVIF